MDTDSRDTLITAYVPPSAFYIQRTPDGHFYFETNLVDLDQIYTELKEFVDELAASQGIDEKWLQQST